MPTVLTHPAIPLLVRALTGGGATSRRLLVAGALGSVVPDLDALGLLVGVPYESPFGHRGFFHSLAFALVVALCALPLATWLRASGRRAFAFVFLGTASHGVLDALTDDGLGVAFLSPFSDRRFFFPWRPIPASPLELAEILSSSGLRVFGAELVLVWLPGLLLVVAAWTARGWRRRGTARDRSGRAAAARTLVGIVTIVAIASVIAGARGGLARSGGHTHRRTAAEPAGTGDLEPVSPAAAIANLRRQADLLAARPAASCPQEFSTFASAGALRISMFYGYDEHDGEVLDRAHAGAMSRVLTSECRGHLAACGFSLASRSPSAVELTRTLAGRRVEVGLFTSSLPDAAREELGPLAAYREQARLSRAVKERFYRELVASDVVFFMGHSRLGGGMGFDDQSGVTTLVDAVSRRPLVPVFAALRQRPTRLRILGLFSCSSKRYFRQALLDANPSLSLILTRGEIRYGPAEQASLGALQAVLASSCGRAFHEAMIAVDEPDPTMTYRDRGR